jgi:hypothetical protein
VENNFDPGAGLCAGGRVGQVALDELHRLQPHQVGSLAGDEAVDAADGFTASQQCRGNRTADKTRRSGYEIARQNNPSMKA